MRKKTVQFWIAILVLLFILVNAAGAPLNICDDAEGNYNKYFKVHEVECDQDCQDAWATVWANETASAK